MAYIERFMLRSAPITRQHLGGGTTTNYYRDLTIRDGLAGARFSPRPLTSIR